MILALLAGSKRMTRRLARGTTRPTHPGSDDLHWRPSPWRKVQPGDRLWVREAWAHDGPDLDSCRRGVESDGPAYGPYYRATEDPAAALSLRWRSPIHMPRWASRLTLTVTAVRVERLQEITYEDVTAEGIETEQFGATAHDPGFRRWRHPNGRFTPHARVAFLELWEMLHGSGAWAANPEVVVLSFSVLRCNIDFEF